jgi:ABC-type transport system substrate-binding protein
LIEQAVVEPDAGKRAELYYEVAKLRYENVPQVNLSQDGERRYEQRWVKNFFWNPVLGYRYFYAYELASGE